MNARIFAVCLELACLWVGNLAQCLDYAIDSGQFDVILCAQNFGQHPRFFQRFFHNFDFVVRKPAPAVTLSSAAFDGPWGLAFQKGKSGPLWILNHSDGTLNEFVPSQIMSSGSPVPKASLSNASDSAYQLTFGPVDGKAGDTN